MACQYAAVHKRALSARAAHTVARCRHALLMCHARCVLHHSTHASALCLLFSKHSSVFGLCKHCQLMAANTCQISLLAVACSACERSSWPHPYPFHQASATGTSSCPAVAVRKAPEHVGSTCSYDHQSHVGRRECSARRWRRSSGPFPWCATALSSTEGCPIISALPDATACMCSLCRALRRCSGRCCVLSAYKPLHAPGQCSLELCACAMQGAGLPSTWEAGVAGVGEGVAAGVAARSAPPGAPPALRSAGTIASGTAGP